MTIFTHEHETKAKNHFALSISCNRTPPDPMTDFDVGKIGQADRNPIFGPDDDAFDLIHILGTADTMHEECAARPRLNAPAADITVIFLDSLDDFVECQAVLDKALRVNAHQE